MPSDKQIYRIVLASPSDVQDERDAVARVVTRINDIKKSAGIGLELIRWEIDANPTFHPRGPQAAIDEVLGIKESDILIGIFYRRFGQPVLDAQSGTEHEINQAIIAYEEHGTPDIKLYFKQPGMADLSTLSKAEFDDVERIRSFKESIAEKGLYSTFQDTSKFEDNVFTHLMKYIDSQLERNKSMQSRVQQLTSSPEHSGIALVRNTISLVSDIKPNTQILVSPGTYMISSLTIERDDNLYFERVHDGKQFVIDGLNDVVIEGFGDAHPELIVQPRYATVITFRNCTNIHLKKLVLGHAPDLGECRGAVLEFENCADVNIEDCDLFGCGTYGLILNNTKRVSVTNTVIHDCTVGIMRCDFAKETAINNCRMYHNKGYDLFDIKNRSIVQIFNCNIYDNQSNTCIFSVDLNALLEVKRTTIQGNVATYFCSQSQGFLITNSLAEENTVCERQYKYRD